MTTQELQAKFDASQDKVNKRLNTISKLCKKLGVNYDNLIKDYEQAEQKVTGDYLPHADAEPVVFSYIQRRDTYVDGKTVPDYWDVCKFNWDVDALVDNLCKLFEVKRVMNNWKAKLDKSTKEDSEEKIPVIWEFLQRWKENAREFFLDNAEEYCRLKANEDEAEEAYKNSEDYKKQLDMWNSYKLSRWDSAEYRVMGAWRKHYYDTIHSITRDVTRVYREEGKYTYEVDEEKLNKILDQEVKAKYKDLVNRITYAVGEILDATNLHISPKGDINGIVIGDKGKAKVETIGAGGYNIQVFHYRTLIHEIK